MYALIMAGGEGTRLWPLSRRSLPKQFLSFTNKRTMIQETVERIKPLIPPEKTLIVTRDIYQEETVRQLPGIPLGNIIAEPMGKGTAPCIGLAAIYICREDPDATMVVLPADHLIANCDEFLRVITVADRVIQEKDYLVTIGLEPAFPATGYGYICLGERIDTIEGKAIYSVPKFVEKPKLPLAKELLATQRCLWNSGIFVWKASTILEEMERFLPGIYQGLVKIGASWGLPATNQVITNVYERIEGISIDYGVLERTKSIVVVRGNFERIDVGNLAALEGIYPKDERGNAVKGEFIGVDSSRNIVYSPGKLVALIGLEGVIIIETEDAILMCPKNRCQEVKLLVEKLQERNKNAYL